jgi:hypothetical protein
MCARRFAFIARAAADVATFPRGLPRRLFPRPLGVRAGPRAPNDGFFALARFAARVEDALKE